MSVDRGPETRRRILIAAEEVLAEHGYDGTTISKVTTRARVPVSSLYWFFKDKDELIAEVVTHSYARWNEAQPEEGEPGGTGAPVADTVSENMSTLVRSLAGEVPALARIGLMLSLERRGEQPAARQRVLDIRQGNRDAIAAWFAEALRASGRPADPDLVARLTQITVVALDGMFLSLQAGNDVDPELFGRFVAASVRVAVEDAAVGAPASDPDPDGATT